MASLFAYFMLAAHSLRFSGSMDRGFPGWSLSLCVFVGGLALAKPTAFYTP